MHGLINAKADQMFRVVPATYLDVAVANFRLIT